MTGSVAVKPCTQEFETSCEFMTQVRAGAQCLQLQIAGAYGPRLVPLSYMRNLIAALRAHFGHLAENEHPR
jgi:hypothetical protein